VIVKVEVHGNAWAYGDAEPPLVLDPGSHELPDPSAELLAALAAAEAVGAVTVLDTPARAAKVMRAAVEADDASLVKQAQAIDSGEWRRGHLAQRLVEVRDAARQLTELEELQQVALLSDEQIEELGRLSALAAEADLLERELSYRPPGGEV
jgi:poly(3-hydroxybutyrate) depolymerase